MVGFCAAARLRGSPLAVTKRVTLLTENPIADQRSQPEAEDQPHNLEYAKFGASRARDIRLGPLDSPRVDIEHPRKNESHRETRQSEGHQNVHRVIGKR